MELLAQLPMALQQQLADWKAALKSVSTAAVGAKQAVVAIISRAADPSVTLMMQDKLDHPVVVGSVVGAGHVEMLVV